VLGSNQLDELTSKWKVSVQVPLQTFSGWNAGKPANSNQSCKKGGAERFRHCGHDDGVVSLFLGSCPTCFLDATLAPQMHQLQKQIMGAWKLCLCCGSQACMWEFHQQLFCRRQIAPLSLVCSPTDVVVLPLLEHTVKTLFLFKNCKLHACTAPSIF